MQHTHIISLSFCNKQYLGKEQETRSPKTNWVNNKFGKKVSSIKKQVRECLKIEIEQRSRFNEH